MTKPSNIYLFANSGFDKRKICGISRLYQIFCIKHGYNLKIIDEKFLSENEPPSKHLRILAVAGGDGTIHRAINSIPNEYIDKYLFGIIPAGTANELAKSIELPKSLVKASEIIVNPKKIIKYHLGCVNQKYRFATGLLYGMSDYVLRVTPQLAKHYLGGLAFNYGALKLFYEMAHLGNNHEVSIQVNEKTIKTNYLLINNANLKSKNLKINHLPNEDENKLNLIYIKNQPNKFELIKLLTKNQLGLNVLNSKYIHYSQHKTLEIKYHDNFTFLLDGESYNLKEKIKIGYCSKPINIIVA